MVPALHLPFDLFTRCLFTFRPSLPGALVPVTTGGDYVTTAVCCITSPHHVDFVPLLFHAVTIFPTLSFGYDSYRSFVTLIYSPFLVLHSRLPDGTRYICSAIRLPVTRLPDLFTFVFTFALPYATFLLLPHTYDLRDVTCCPGLRYSMTDHTFTLFHCGVGGVIYTLLRSFALYTFDIVDR